MRSILALCLLMLSLAPVTAIGNYGGVGFYRLTNRQGLSNSQVKAILKDKQGFVWFGTMSGLDRFDGFRIKTFLYDDGNPNSIPNNTVDDIQQAANGDLWVHTGTGYCIYQHDKEQFDRKPEEWLKTIGVEGTPYRLLIDSKKNMWMAVYGKGIYFVDTKSMNAYLFHFDKKPAQGAIPDYNVACISEQNGQAVVTFDNGWIYRLDGYSQQVVWKNGFIATSKLLTDNAIFTYVDNQHNYWMSTNADCFVYSQTQKKWILGAKAFLASMGVSLPASLGSRLIVRDLQPDQKGHEWIATDHDGLLCVNYAKHQLSQFIYNPNDENSLSGNALQKVYIDDKGALWVGTYKNGVNYYSDSATKFYTIPLGDVNSVTQDQNGNLWCGTNDAGIVVYNPITGQSSRFTSAQTHLGSDVIVCSTTMKDGTLYFGTFNGGLARYSHGIWKSYLTGTSGLANNSVWCLAEAPDHRLLIGTLGGGFQIFNPVTEKFETYNTSNSKLKSNYLNSLFMQNANQLLIGHSENLSIFDFRNRQITNIDKMPNGKSFISPSINYAMLDSRGILWLATPAGIAMYDTKSEQYEYINELNGTQGAVGCAIIEDKQHTMWLISEFLVTRVKLDKENDSWNLNMATYSSLDGLQDRQFNNRSACLLHNGDIAIGGQDGVSIIKPQRLQMAKSHVRALFSGLVLFDHALTAGEKYEGRVVLKESLDACRRLDLSYKDNAFTIQLAASEVTVPARSRFLYRMKGVNDKWLLTPADHPEVTFTNLSAGSYVLQVKVVNGDGSVNDEISELEINVAPPFYLSIWAFFVYILLIVGGLLYYRRRVFAHQRHKYERQSMEENMKKTRELNELKLNFFTNVSHELRTPLALIISPLENMIREEENAGKRRKLELIHRNAIRLLNLVNQILDFRKFDQNKEKLNLARTEIVSYIDNICSSFRILANNKVTLEFESEFPKYTMSVDADKVGKIVNNLLSNAYKFTPDGGKITVSLRAKTRYEMKGGDHDMLCISVADTGKGISDKEKKHVFERFYQVNGTEMQPAGGSGIGLNLVKKFAELHGGTASVKDNPAGGSIFTVELPIEDTGSAKVNAHLGTLRTAPVIATLHKGEDSKDSEEEDTDKAASLYGMARPVERKVLQEAAEKPVLLLVDDSDDFREFMCGLLSDSYTVIEAVNGKDAWDKMIDRRPDIILSDVMMPVMDGNELCKQVKENDETASIPFVMLTARLADEHRKEGLASGADEYITKPFNIDMLTLRLKNLLNLVRRSGGATLKSENGAKTGQLNKGNFVLNSADQKLIEDVDAYIQENLSDPNTSVESMSAHLNISRVQLYKRLISIKGITPSEYLRAKRIKRAEELLHDRGLNVSEVAYKVGFNNPRYFSKYFQEEYGMTPSQYKKQFEK